MLALADPLSVSKPGPEPLGRQLADILAQLRDLRDLLEARRKPLMTVAEVADLVGRDPYTVRNWIKSGRLAATRVAGTGPKGRLLVSRDELDRLLAAGRGGSVPGVALP